MALDLLSSDDHHLEEDYIDMEISSYSYLFSNNSTRISPTSSSPPNNNPREFEFQMSSATSKRDQPTTSPADELFYKGKLLPLHLPPRLQMVEKLLENSNSFSSSFGRLNISEASFDSEFFSTPLMTTAPTPTATSTPFESCNISPSESFRISRELINPDEYMSAFSAELSSGLSTNEENSGKKSLAKRLKNTSLGSKLKASRAYLKSFFGKTGCTDESSTAARKVADEGSALRCVKANKRNNNPFGQIQRDHKSQTPNGKRVEKTEKTADEACEKGGAGRHRRSFSLALRRQATTTTTTTNKPSSSSLSTSTSSSSSSSTSSSSSSSGSSSFSISRLNASNCRVGDQLKYLKRCGSANNSEIESSIQGAIAHCKQSQQMFHSRNSISASRIGVCTEEQERPEICRG